MDRQMGYMQTDITSAADVRYLTTRLLFAQTVNALHEVVL